MTEQSRGVYFVIEGTDGSGKTKQAELLSEYLKGLGRTVINVEEPGGTPIGKQLREIIKDKSLERSPQTNLDLFTICRRELVEQVIAVATAEGSDVLCDRNWFSSYAYQGYGEGVSIEEIAKRSKEALGEFFIPDFTVVIDVSVEVAESRREARDTNSAADRFESENRKFFERVREGYLKVAREYDIPVVDGSGTIEEVHRSILNLLSKRELLG